jgi:uncharacterized protein
VGREGAVIDSHQLLRDVDVGAYLLDIAVLDSQALSEAARGHGLDLIVLFGSTARGRRRPGSDLDVAIHFGGPWKQPPSLEEEALASDALFRVLRPCCELDVAVLNRASPLLRWNVARHGIPLYCPSPSDWVIFRIGAHRDYEDSARFRRRQWEVLLRRLNGGATRG